MSQSINISSLRRCFDAAVKVDDWDSVLEILEKLYYAEEFDLFEQWQKEAKPLMNAYVKEQEERWPAYPEVPHMEPITA